MSRRRRAGLLAAAGCLPLVLGGCGVFGGGGEDIVEPPAELVPFNASIRVRRLWSTRVGGGTERLRLGLMPATDGANIYAGAYDGRIVAVNAQTGRASWSIDTDLPLAAGPAYGDGLLVFGTEDGQVILFDAISGEERWRVAVGSEVLAPPVLGNDVVAFRSIDGRLRGLSVDDGSELWSIEQNLAALTLRGDTAPQIAGPVVVSGFDNGRVGAYNLSNGLTLWEIPLAAPSGTNELERLVDIGAGVAIAGNNVYAAGYQGRVVGMDLNSGAVLWQQEVSSFSGIEADLVNVYLSDDVGSVIAYNRRNGAPVWRQEALRMRDVTAPARFLNTLVVGDLEGYLHFIDPADGEFIARDRAASDRITSPPLVVGQAIYVQSDDGTLAAYALRDDSN